MSMAVDIAGAQGASEPEWLRARRREGLDFYSRLPLPSRTDEEWRRTELKGLDLDALQAAPAVAPSTRIDAPVAEGLTAVALEEAVIQHQDLLRDRLLSLAGTGRDKFAALHAARHRGGALVHVADGVSVAEPVTVSIEGGSGLVLPHTVVVAGRNASVTVIQDLTSSPEPALASGSVEIFAGEGASVAFVSVQRLGGETWQFADQLVRAERDSSVRLTVIGLGGRFSKNRVEAALVGPGATAELKALYFGTGAQFFDYHTKQDHQAPNTTSDLLFKGALRDGARSVYSGLIRIEKGAGRSDAYQANRNLLLSERAKADSIPMLEILTNDVRCTHGATVGPVDPEHLFYLVSRGIPRPTAQRMIVQGFFQEVLDRIPDAATRERIEGELESRIG